jgi:uncharacterized membrane protein
MWILGLLLATGAFLRLYRLDHRSLSQAEVYVPNLPLPAQISIPPERATLMKTLSNTMWDFHPPTWYLAMWFWTKASGTSLFAMRLPQALLGIASILLIYAVARYETDRPIALIAAALLAINGHHIHWSQNARPYSAACCLGILSTLLLLRAARDREQTGWLLPAYGIVSVCGLTTIYYYWVLAAAQIAWVLGSGFRRRWLIPVFHTQMTSVILATPAITLAVFQAQPSYLEDSQGNFFADLIGFAFLFERDPFTPRPLPFTPATRAAYFAAGAMFLATGVVAVLRASRSGLAINPVPRRAPLRTIAAATAFALIMILGASAVFYTKQPARIVAFLATALAPLAVLGFAIGVESMVAGSWLRATNASSIDNPPVKSLSLSLLLAVIPSVLVGLVSLGIPFFASRQMIVVTPYVLILMAVGIATAISWIPRPVRWPAAAGLAVWLAMGHVAGYAYQAERPQSPQDYSGLADQLVPKIGSTDLIFVRPLWRMTPIFYYLQRQRDQLIGSNYSEAVRQHPGAAVWFLTFPGIEPTSEMARALAAHSEIEAVTARQIVARHFVPISGAK